VAFPDRFERGCSERWRATQLRTISEMTFALVMVLASITVAFALLLLSVALAPEPEFFTSAIVSVTASAFAGDDGFATLFIEDARGTAACAPLALIPLQI
jgi:hypothetical protein